MPVAPTLRRSSTGTLLQTNLTADGGAIYGKGCLLMMDSNIELLRREKALDAAFIHIIKTQIDEIIKQAEYFATLASDNRAVLPDDDAFELLISKDGSWKLVILDLAKAEISSSMSDELIRKRNSQSTDKCMRWMRQLSKKLENKLATFMQNLLRGK